MLFDKRLEQASLLRRYKRFLADIRTAGGEVVTVHCPNTGSMRNCLQEGAPIWYSRSANPKRKYPLTWEIATTPAGHLAGIHSARANLLVREALVQGLLPELGEIGKIKAEVRCGVDGSRLDFAVQSALTTHFIEVKSVTLCEGEGRGFFPDAVSTRGRRHLQELTALARRGESAVLVFCVQHTGIHTVAPARHIDAAYSAAFDEALDAGVRAYALGAKINDREIVLNRRLPVLKDQGVM